LGRMHPCFAGNLVDGFGAFQGFEGNFRLKFCTVSDLDMIFLVD